MGDFLYRILLLNLYRVLLMLNKRSFLTLSIMTFALAGCGEEENIEQASEKAVVVQLSEVKRAAAELCHSWCFLTCSFPIPPLLITPVYTLDEIVGKNRIEKGSPYKNKKTNLDTDHEYAGKQPAAYTALREVPKTSKNCV